MKSDGGILDIELHRYIDCPECSSENVIQPIYLGASEYVECDLCKTEYRVLER